MHLTEHACGRIADRTKMSPVDVLAMLEAGASIFLGRSENREYLLFHSEKDRTSKIAVVDKDHSVIITVWNKEFTLPKGVSRPDRGSEHRAERKWRIFSKLEQPAEAVYIARIEVKVGFKTEYVHLAGEVPEDSARGINYAVTHLRPHLEKIATVAEDCKSRIEAPIDYYIRLLKPGTSELIAYYHRSHEKMFSYLNLKAT